MKRPAAILIAILAFCLTAKAQTGSVSLGWTPNVAPGVVSQKVYRANCAGTVTAGVCSTDATATFAVLPAGSAIPVTTSTFTDATPARGQAFIYYLTNVCPATGACVGESGPSIHVTAIVPGVAPPPPSGLTILSVASIVTGNTQTVIAKWTDPSGASQYFAFSDGIKPLAQGLTSSPNGTFAQKWTGLAGTPITFIACNMAGSCGSQKAN